MATIGNLAAALAADQSQYEVSAFSIAGWDIWISHGFKVDDFTFIKA
jgi:hypothetical protein